LASDLAAVVQVASWAYLAAACLVLAVLAAWCRYPVVWQRTAVVCRYPAEQAHLVLEAARPSVVVLDRLLAGRSL
jgi:hypothetical protein